MQSDVFTLPHSCCCFTFYLFTQESSLSTRQLVEVHQTSKHLFSSSQGKGSLPLSKGLFKDIQEENDQRDHPVYTCPLILMLLIMINIVNHAKCEMFSQNSAESKLVSAMV